MGLSNKSFITKIAAILLLLSGILAILVWITLFSNENYIIYGLTGVILAIFPMIAGFLALIRKLWIITLVFSIIGLFTILTPLILSGIFASIGFILIVISKKDFT